MCLFLSFIPFSSLPFFKWDIRYKFGKQHYELLRLVFVPSSAKSVTTFLFERSAGKLKSPVAENESICRVGLCITFALFLLLECAAAEVLGEEDVS